MDITDKLWIDKWSKIHYDGFNIEIRKKWGSDKEPESSLWLSSLLESTGDHFKEGMTVLDYGCGGGRLASFLSQRLQNFMYYGIDRKESWAAQEINELQTFSDNRAKFGFLTDTIEQEALDAADVVVLGSIFTHLSFKCENESESGDSFVTICNKFLPIMERGGAVAFSAFIDNTIYDVDEPNFYDVKGCYPRSYYTLDAMNQYCEENGLDIVEVESFLAQKLCNHRIFRMISASNLNR